MCINDDVISRDMLNWAVAFSLRSRYLPGYIDFLQILFIKIDDKICTLLLYLRSRLMYVDYAKSPFL
jgi:hypothetical protein